MSFDYYAHYWIATKKNYLDLVDYDDRVKKTYKPVKNRTLANRLIGGLYAKYSLMVQELTTCLDMLAQVQKSFTMRKIVDSATIRLEELSDELRKIDISEYHYIDGNLIELKIIPHDVEIIHPMMFHPRHPDIEKMWRKLQYGEKIYVPFSSGQPSMQNLVAESIPTVEIALEKNEEEKKALEDEDPKKKEEDTKKRRRPKAAILVEVKDLTPDQKKTQDAAEHITEAILKIQKNERGRQARVYLMDASVGSKRIKLLNEGKKLPSPVNPEVAKSSALVMQKIWRGYAVRQEVARQERNRRLLIGMTEPSYRSTKCFEKVEQDLKVRRELKVQKIREYIDANLAEKDRVVQLVEPGLMEDIGDEIREWFRYWYQEARNFDKYPDPEKGGSILVIRGETMTPQEWIDEVERKRKEKQRAKEKGIDLKAVAKAEKEKKKKEEAERKRKEKEQKKKEEAAKKKKSNRPEDFEYEFYDTLTKPLLKEGLIEHEEIWDQIDEFENPEENHYLPMITSEKFHELQIEARAKVDELMRLELELLNDALEKDRLKGKKGKKKKKKPKKKKKGKKKKGKKDPTGHRTTEDLFQELYDNGIIRTYPKAHLSDYLGDFSYNNWEWRKMNFDPPSNLGEVRTQVCINCIVPLGVTNMKKPKSVLIIGPRQSGKHVLANAVFNETRCVLFDLSPKVLAGKYEGKAGMKMLVHLIGKMSRLLQPSVIYFDGAEKPFYKKVPKDEKEFEPKRMGSQLIKKIIKPIQPADRVLVLGISGQPWAAGAKLKKAYERVILIPKPDYNTIFLYWRQLLMRYHAFDREFDITALTKLTVNFPLPEIKSVVEKVLTTRRIIQLSYKPLQAIELYEHFINSPGPISPKEYKKFDKWYGKTKIAKERKYLNKFYDKLREIEKKNSEKKK